MNTRSFVYFNNCGCFKCLVKETAKNKWKGNLITREGKGCNKAINLEVGEIVGGTIEFGKVWVRRNLVFKFLFFCILEILSVTDVYERKILLDEWGGLVF